MSSCLICRDDIMYTSDALCITCWKDIDFLSSRDEDIVAAAVEYNHLIRKLIHIFKYSSPWKMSSLFTRWLTLTNMKRINDTEIILPVPMHKYKIMKRGYNQAAVLAKNIARKHKKKCLLNVLTRTKNVRAQSTLNQEERMTNVIGSFGVLNHRLINNKRILIVDDVTTTGSTMMECIETIKPFCASVNGLCVAKTSIV